MTNDRGGPPDDYMGNADFQAPEDYETFEAVAEDGTAFAIRVHPQTAPTAPVGFHARATHRDALGMPVAFSQPFPDDAPWPYHPTPCCGAAASISDGPMYCKACYQEVDPAFGNVPVVPFEELLA